MPKPTVPVVPPPALRSDPDNFSARIEANLIFQGTQNQFMSDTNDFVEEMNTAVEGNASTATSAAGTATSAAGTATSQAGIATTAAETATTQAGIATSAASAADAARILAQGAAASSNLSGRNLIINGDGRINQRGYASGSATSGANQFTLDRWFVITSGQNLAFTGDNSGRVMTAPAGGVGQAIEPSNIKGGSYVLNWTGTATATVNGVARTKGEIFTLAANTTTIVRFFGGTFTDVQLERGTVITPFEMRNIQKELALCQRFHWQPTAISLRIATTTGSVQPLNDAFIKFPVTMRVNPTVSVSYGDGVNIGSPGSTVTTDGIKFSCSSNGGGYATYVANFFAAFAEFTS